MGGGGKQVFVGLFHIESPIILCTALYNVYKKDASRADLDIKIDVWREF